MKSQRKRRISREKSQRKRRISRSKDGVTASDVASGAKKVIETTGKIIKKGKELWQDPKFVEARKQLKEYSETEEGKRVLQNIKKGAKGLIEKASEKVSKGLSSKKKESKINVNELTSSEKRELLETLIRELNNNEKQELIEMLQS